MLDYHIANYGKASTGPVPCTLPQNFLPHLHSLSPFTLFLSLHIYCLIKKQKVRPRLVRGIDSWN
jgi:hypothetical protein